VLAGAAIQPWLRGEPPGRLAANLFFLTDASWLIATRYREEGGRDGGVLFGAGIALWALWVVATVPGYLAGALVSEPRRFGLDLVMPIFFSAMLVPLWRGARAARPWAVAGAVALVVQALVPGYAFIVAGALAGAVAGAFLE
jgi:predicted branched-subunit amino acid permease